MKRLNTVYGLNGFGLYDLNGLIEYDYQSVCLREGITF